MHAAVLHVDWRCLHLLLVRFRTEGGIDVLGESRSAPDAGAAPGHAAALLAAQDRHLGDCRRIAFATQDAAPHAEALRRDGGVSAVVLSAGEHAWLTWRGATAGLAPRNDKVAVVAIGDGSTSFAVGEGRECLLARVVPAGAVRAGDTLVPPGAPLDARRKRAIADWVRRTAGGAARAVRAHGAATLVLASGTARALARLAAARRGRETPGTLRPIGVLRLAAELAALWPDEIVGLGVDRARAASLATGAQMLATLLELLGAEEAVVSGWGLREGVALREAERVAAGRTSPGRHRLVTAI